MIVLMVGTQAPFDRLVQAVDVWAGAGDRPTIVAQVGHGRYMPKHMSATPYFTPVECREWVMKSQFVVAHAGMGTILSALELGKPVIVMPRRADLGEHRNDHQIATADRLGRMNLVSVARTPAELTSMLSVRTPLSGGRRIRPFASDPLISGLRKFLHEVAGSVP